MKFELDSRHLIHKGIKIPIYAYLLVMPNLKVDYVYSAQHQAPEFPQPQRTGSSSCSKTLD